VTARVTRFPARAAGPADRLSDFVAHLRLNGFALGPGETATALAALGAVDACDPVSARLALRAVCATDAERDAAFDALFDAFWMNGGRVRLAPAPPPRAVGRRPGFALARPPEAEAAAGEGAPEAPDDDGAGEGTEAEGRRLAARRSPPTRRDLREIAGPAELAEAERAAERIARAIRDRRSRRRRAARRGAAVDLRRTLRAALARGGEPLELKRRRRPDRPARLFLLLDVSGSMTVHARVFLAFLRGLLGADATARAWLFHDRLVGVTDALRDRDPLRAAARLGLMAEGFGGGTRIGRALAAFAADHAGRALTRRAVVIVLSDGYCADPPGALTDALARIRRRAGRIVWLDPLMGGPGYAPAPALAAALPTLDALLPARSLEGLAALEAEFARL
jgi:uncharacterized protein with von Willebrand factor type A (vWA) domain